MRRRIYVDPEGDLQDRTDSPDSYADEQPWTEVAWCRTGVLRDEVLWAQYLVAVAEVSRLRRMVVEQLRYEPPDEVETRIAARVEHMCSADDWDPDEIDRLRAESMKNASRWCCISCERAELGDLYWLNRKFPMCPECGNKRCPRATFHDNTCTGSNESGQPGSEYQ